MPYVFQVWRLVKVKDDTTSTWELLDDFPNAKRARAFILDQAGSSILSSEDNETNYWYEDLDGTHTFRIEPVLT